MIRVSQLWDYILTCGFQENTKKHEGHQPHDDDDEEEDDDEVEDNNKDNDNNKDDNDDKSISAQGLDRDLGFS